MVKAESRLGLGEVHVGFPLPPVYLLRLYRNILIGPRGCGGSGF